jgi:hypothetical protein
VAAGRLEDANLTCARIEDKEAAEVVNLKTDWFGKHLVHSAIYVPNPQILLSMPSAQLRRLLGRGEDGEPGCLVSTLLAPYEDRTSQRRYKYRSPTKRAVMKRWCFHKLFR